MPLALSLAKGEQHERRFHVRQIRSSDVMSSSRLAVVVKGWPRLSETFIAQELVGLEAAGASLEVWSLRRPTDRHRHALHAALAAPVRYLPEYLWHEPRRVWRSLRIARRLPGYRAARAAWLADLKRDPTPNRIRRFGQALVLAAELPADVGQLYAHFLHTPASVARYAALLRGLPWAASAHAKDIWTTPDWEKRAKLAAARFVVTCTRAGADHLRALAPAPGRVELVHHGLDPARFPPIDRARPPIDGRDPRHPVVILSVGRAVAKKGYDDLLAALALLPGDVHWRFVHVGGGPLLRRLHRQARRLGIARRCEWRGALAHDAVLAAYREADVFALASRIAADGDRDGIPNVLVEAMSQGLAVVATAAASIPELVADAVTGRLVPPEDRTAMATALAGVIGDPALRQRLGAAAERRVRVDFPHAPGVIRIARLLGVAARGAAPIAVAR